MIWFFFCEFDGKERMLNGRQCILVALNECEQHKNRCLYTSFDTILFLYQMENINISMLFVVRLNVFLSLCCFLWNMHCTLWISSWLMVFIFVDIKVTYLISSSIKTLRHTNYDRPEVKQKQKPSHKLGIPSCCCWNEMSPKNLNEFSENSSDGCWNSRVETTATDWSNIRFADSNFWIVNGVENLNFASLRSKYCTGVSLNNT